MANFAQMQFVTGGFTRYTKHTNQTSFPAKSYATPGIYANSLYSRYVACPQPQFDAESPLYSKKKLKSPNEQDESDLTAPKLLEQVGRGEPSTSTKPPSPYNDDKMKKVLEKMRNPVFGVEVHENKDSLKKLPKRKKVEPKKEKSEPEPKYYKWY